MNREKVFRTQLRLLGLTMCVEGTNSNAIVCQGQQTQAETGTSNGVSCSFFILVTGDVASDRMGAGTGDTGHGRPTGFH